KASKELWKQSNQAVFGKLEPTDEELAERSPALHVSASAPPAFIWHTADDDLVYAENALRLAAAYAAHRVPYELHVFENGVHGLSLSSAVTASIPEHVNPDAAVWFDLAISWLSKRF